VIHRAEDLPEFVSLLETLPVDLHRHTGPLPSLEEVEDASLVIVPGERLASGTRPNLDLWPRTIAVVDGASKTMLAHLDRLGASVIVQRPIHPRALRLLLLHELYRGPERRRRRRTSIGYPIRVGAGLFKQRAILLELSSTGAGLELAPIPKIGAVLKLILGRELTGSRPLKLRGKVVRVVKPAADERGAGVVGLRLLDAKTEAQAIAFVLKRFDMGPARWQGARSAHGPAVAEQTRPIPTDAPAAGKTPSAATKTVSATRKAPNPANKAPATAERPSETPPMETIDPEVSARRLPPTRPREKIAESRRTPERANEASGPSDRRQSARIPYDRRVVALGNEAARILIGRDLSPGGMRITRSDHVAVGDQLRVALHCGTEMEPLIVRARAERDDGEDGFVLGFDELSPSQRDRLEKIIASNESLSEIEAGGSFVLGELLDPMEDD
jgi:hypothetical protein